MSRKVILVTGASSGFGRLTAEALARAGYSVYASMRDTRGRNAPQVEAIARFAEKNGADLRAIELDVQSQDSVDRAVGEAIVQVVAAPFGRRPFRVHIDPAGDGADVGFTVLDRLRAEMLHRVGLSDLLKPTSSV
jgi:NAD(P)-dependent dehydrogenase (short-subunit alcohol dehydrogenase family)